MTPGEPWRDRDLEQTVKALQVLERQHEPVSYAQQRDVLVARVIEAYQQEGRDLTLEQARHAVEVVMGPDPAALPPPPPLPPPPTHRWYHNQAMVFWVVLGLVLSVPLARLLSRLLGLLVRM